MQLGQEPTILKVIFLRPGDFVTQHLRDTTFTASNLADEKEKRYIDTPFLTASDLGLRYATSLRMNAKRLYKEVLQSIWQFIFGFSQQAQIDASLKLLNDAFITIRAGKEVNLDQIKDIFFPKINYKTLSQRDLEGIADWFMSAIKNLNDYKEVNAEKDFSLFEYERLPPAIKIYLKDICRKDQRAYGEWFKKTRVLLADYTQAQQDISSQTKMYDDKIKLYLKLLSLSVKHNLEENGSASENDLKAIYNSLDSQWENKSPDSKDKKFIRDFEKDHPDYVLISDCVKDRLEKVYSNGQTGLIGNQVVVLSFWKSVTFGIAYHMSRMILISDPERNISSNLGIYEVLAFRKEDLRMLFKDVFTRGIQMGFNINQSCKILVDNIKGMMSKDAEQLKIFEKYFKEPGLLLTDSPMVIKPKFDRTTRKLTKEEKGERKKAKAAKKDKSPSPSTSPVPKSPSTTHPTTPRKDSSSEESHSSSSMRNPLVNSSTSQGFIKSMSGVGKFFDANSDKSARTVSSPLDKSKSEPLDKSPSPNV